MNDPMNPANPTDPPPEEEAPTEEVPAAEPGEKYDGGPIPGTTPSDGDE